MRTLMEGVVGAVILLALLALAFLIY